MSIQKYIIIGAVLISISIILAPIFLYEYKIDQCVKTYIEPSPSKADIKFVNDYCTRLINKG